MSGHVQSGEAMTFAGPGDARVELVSATCACCCLKEECTPAYVAEVRERYGGRWVCGLCGEAIKDEIRRAMPRISMEEALSRHATFSESFRSAPSPPTEASEQLIAAMRQLLRRGLDSPRAVRSTPNSPLHEAAASPSPAASGDLARSSSCFSTLSRFIKQKGKPPKSEGGIIE